MRKSRKNQLAVRKHPENIQTELFWNIIFFLIIYSRVIIFNLLFWTNYPSDLSSALRYV